MNKQPHRMLIFALGLVLAHALALALSWDAGLEALTGMYGHDASAWTVLAALLYALSWLGAVALAPILALASALWLSLNALIRGRRGGGEGLRAPRRGA